MISLYILRAAEDLLMAGGPKYRIADMEAMLDAAAGAALWGEWDEPDLSLVLEALDDPRVLPAGEE